MRKTTALELTGRVFGRLIVLRRTNNDVEQRKSRWLCQCECGNEIIVIGTSLTSYHTMSCGCLQKESCQLPKTEASFNLYYGRYVTSTNKTDRRFDLSKDQFRKITSSDCYYCGRGPTEISSKAHQQCNGAYKANGIDRIDNAKGYTIDNCVPCCTPCNIAKATRTSKEFKEWSVRLYNNFGSKKD